jgi:hypothetical protein
MIGERLKKFFSFINYKLWSTNELKTTKIDDLGAVAIEFSHSLFTAWQPESPKLPRALARYCFSRLFPY